MILICCIHFWKILSGLFPLVIGAIALYVANEQKNITKRKLNLDLYEKRYKNYSETKEFISKTIAKKDFSEDVLKSFRINTNEKDFLFESEIKDFINQVDLKSADLHMSRQYFNNQPTAEMRKSLKELTKWFNDQYDSIEIIFQKYLDFKKLK